MDWLKLFDPGRPLAVAVKRGGKGGDPQTQRMKSRVDHRSSTHVWVLVPPGNELGSRAPFTYDERVSLELGEDSGVFLFPATVRRYETRPNGDCAVLELVGDPVHRQRRSHVRVPTLTPVSFTILGRSVRGWVRNLSAGGMLAALEKHEQLNPDQIVPFQLEPNEGCPPEDKHPITGRARVVRGDEGVYAFDFLALPETHRQWLVRYVFRRQIELRNLEREQKQRAAAGGR